MAHSKSNQGFRDKAERHREHARAARRELVRLALTMAPESLPAPLRAERERMEREHELAEEALRLADYLKERRAAERGRDRKSKRSVLSRAYAQRWADWKAMTEGGRTRRSRKARDWPVGP